MTNAEKFAADQAAQARQDAAPVVSYVSVPSKALVDVVADAARFHAGIAEVSEAAWRAHRGSGTVEVEAAQNIAVAKFKAEFVGAVPPQTVAERNAEIAQQKAEADKAAQAAEVARLSAKV